MEATLLACLKTSEKRPALNNTMCPATTQATPSGKSTLHFSDSNTDRHCAQHPVLGYDTQASSLVFVRQVLSQVSRVHYGIDSQIESTNRKND